MAVTSSTKEETSVVYYCKMGNPDGLGRANYKLKMQRCSSKMDNGMEMVVEKQTMSTDVYSLMVKAPMETEDGLLKYKVNTVNVSEDFFKTLLDKSPTFSKFTRHIFVSSSSNLTFSERGVPRHIDMPKVDYEVDVFQQEDGSVCEWVRVEIVVDDIINRMEAKHPGIKDMEFKFNLGSLPIGLSGAIPEATATIEQKQIMDHIKKAITLGKNVR